MVETEEGVPPPGLLLIQAHFSGEDGVLSRDQCDFAAPHLEAQGELDLLRRLHATDAALTVTVTGARGPAPEETRILADGPISRWADRAGRLPPLPPGVYRLTVSAPGHRTGSQVALLAAGACPQVEIRLDAAGETGRN